MSLRRRVLGGGDDGILWLYKDGDECIDVTGGYLTNQSYLSIINDPSSGTLTLNNSGTAYNSSGTCYTISNIDFTGYSKLHMICSGTDKNCVNYGGHSSSISIGSTSIGSFFSVGAGINNAGGRVTNFSEQELIFNINQPIIDKLNINIVTAGNQGWYTGYTTVIIKQLFLTKD